jgi:hypothetical protein
MEKIHIPASAVSIVSTSSKGDQSKWLIKEKWVKQNTRGSTEVGHLSINKYIKDEISTHFL